MVSTAAPDASRSRLFQWIAWIVLTWAIAYPFSGQLTYALQKGNGLADLVDAYSEADAVRAGEGYADHGFLKYYGLPEVSYGNSFDNMGGKHDKNLCAQLPCIYLHYPPGADMIVGVMTKMCGKGQIFCYRSAPLLTSLFALCLLAWSLTKCFGVERAAFVMGSFYFAPMLTNGMHNIFGHSYEAAFILCELALCLYAFFGRPIKPWAVLGALFLVGFFQGWMSFDNAFHVAMIPLPVWLMTGGDLKKTRRLFLQVSAAACFGYAFACILHFTQVVLYLGSLKAAYLDFSVRAAQRMAGHVESGGNPNAIVQNILVYLTVLLPLPHFLGMSFIALIVPTFVALLPQTPILLSKRLSLVWQPGPFFRWSLVAAFVIPLMWLLVMRQHMSVHGHFLPRNFGITYVTGAILLAVSIRRATASRAAESAAADAETPEAA